jgi:D-ribose pyranose/furanose isomerase RbsD
MLPVTLPLHRLLVLPLLLLLNTCSYSSRDGWKAAIEVQTAQLGYRNWIVVAEASFPAHSRPGTRQVNAYQPIPVVLDEVLRTLERTEHVRPKIYVPQELRAVENDFAPGVDEYRRMLEASLHGHVTTELDQDSLVTLVQDAQKSFDVLVIRTTTALPYSSVFLELHPGYWDGESEQRLREQMQRGRMEKIASPAP